MENSLSDETVKTLQELLRDVCKQGRKEQERHSDSLATSVRWKIGTAQTGKGEGESAGLQVIFVWGIQTYAFSCCWSRRLISKRE